MKRVSFIFVLFIFTASLSAQRMTTLSGRLLNRTDQAISLSVLSFDSGMLIGQDEKGYKNKQVLKALVQPDSTFVIKTESVTWAFTLAKLKFGGKEIELILSPGDSLYMDFDYWTFNSVVHWNGIGAGRNNYWSRSSEMFSERLKAIGGKYDPVRIDMRRELRDDQLEFLNSYLSEEIVDSSYFDWESRRIQYNCYDSNVRYGIWHNQRRSTVRNEPSEIFSELDINDEEALFTIPRYRSLIRTYLGFIVDPNNDNPKGKFKLLLELGQKRLSGQVQSYFLWTTIDMALQGALDQNEKELIWDYAWVHVDDRRVKSILASNKIMSSSQKKSVTDLFSWYGPQIIMFLALIILIYGLIRYKKFLKGKGSKINGMAFIKNGLILLFLIFSIYILRDSGELLGWVFLWLVSLIVFLIVHTFWLIPRFILKKKYLLYGISLTLLVVAYFFAIFLIVKAEPNAWFGDKSIDTSLVLCLASSTLTVLFSFAFFYASYLSRRKKGFAFLLEERLINLEITVHIILIAIFFFSLVVNIESASDTGSLFSFIVGVIIFYLTAFFIIPRYIFTRKFGQFFLASSIVFICVIILQAGYNGASSFFRLHSQGINVSFFKTLSFPSLFLFAIAIPALVYAYVRKIIADTESHGFSLFRNKEAELNQLRSQVNPHFLFNSLNTVYAFALKEGNDKTAESIAKLANLMRYLIEDMEQESIPIRKEIGYIEDYVKLQSIRSSVEHDIMINIELNDEQRSLRIAPMLMIPFVENAFKHGVNPNNPSELKINISIVDDHFQFVVENSLDQEFETFDKEKGFGIGIQNVRQRLEHIYPDEHTLSIAETNERFIVIMSISL